MTICYLLATYDFVDNRITDVFTAGETYNTITRCFGGPTTILEICKTSGRDYQEAHDMLVSFLYGPDCPECYRWARALMNLGDKASMLHRYEQLTGKKD